MHLRNIAFSAEHRLPYSLYRCHAICSRRPVQATRAPSRVRRRHGSLRQSAQSRDLVFQHLHQHGGQTTEGGRHSPRNAVCPRRIPPFPHRKDPQACCTASAAHRHALPAAARRSVSAPCRHRVGGGPALAGIPRSGVPRDIVLHMGVNRPVHVVGAQNPGQWEPLRHVPGDPACANKQWNAWPTWTGRAATGDRCRKRRSEEDGSSSPHAPAAGRNPISGPSRERRRSPYAHSRFSANEPKTANSP